MELFDDIVGPVLTRLEKLLEADVTKDAVWRNDFCRYLSFIKEAFSGIGALAKEEASQEERDAYYASTDLP